MCSNFSDIPEKQDICVYYKIHFKKPNMLLDIKL